MTIQDTALRHAHVGEGGGFIRYQAGCSLSHRSQPSSHVRTWSFGGQVQAAKPSTRARDASVPSPRVQTLRSSHAHLISVLRDLCWGAVRVQWIEGQVGLVRGDAGPMIRGSDSWKVALTRCATLPDKTSCGTRAPRSIPSGLRRRAALLLPPQAVPTALFGAFHCPPPC